MPTVGSLFSGAGGFDLGFHAAGFRTAWMAEWAGAPRKVLRAHWPDVPLKGDVRRFRRRHLKKLTRRHGAIDVLIFGSPCQDMSVAGLRAGLEGSRSRLFHEAIRIWHEVAVVQGFYPELLWENVDGARSSNGGADFGVVLGTFVGAAVPVPASGWRSAGVVAGPTGVAAWRVLDAQYFGVPQRRRRVFVLGTRTGRIDPAEVLALGEGVRGDSPTCEEAGEDASGRAGCGIADTLVAGGRETGPHGSLDGRNLVYAFDWQNSPSQGMAVRSASSDALLCGAVPAVLAFNTKQDGADADPIAPTLLAMPHDRSHANGGGQLGVPAFDTTQITSATNRSKPQPGDPCHPLAATAHPPAICVTGEQTHALTHEGADASEDGTGRGTPIIANTLRHQTHPTSAAGEGEIFMAHGIPRRLTPRECERLMGWPDDWTLPAGSDSARYRICGNGVVKHVAWWIAERIAAQLAEAA